MSEWSSRFQCCDAEGRYHAVAQRNSNRGAPIRPPLLWMLIVLIALAACTAHACAGETTFAPVLPADIKLSADGDASNFHDLVFDGSRYVVVWTSRESGKVGIQGQFIGTDGAKGTSFLIADADAATSPKIARAGSGFLVVYSTNNGISGAVVDSAGHVGPVIPICTAENTQISRDHRWWNEPARRLAGRPHLRVDRVGHLRSAHLVIGYLHRQRLPYRTGPGHSIAPHRQLQRGELRRHLDSGGDRQLGGEGLLRRTRFAGRHGLRPRRGRGLHGFGNPDHPQRRLHGRPERCDRPRLDGRQNGPDVALLDDGLARGRGPRRSTVVGAAGVPGHLLSARAPVDHLQRQGLRDLLCLQVAGHHLAGRHRRYRPTAPASAPQLRGQSGQDCMRIRRDELPRLVCDVRLRPDLRATGDRREPGADRRGGPRWHLRGDTGDWRPGRQPQHRPGRRPPPLVYTGLSSRSPRTVTPPSQFGMRSRRRSRRPYGASTWSS